MTVKIIKIMKCNWGFGNKGMHRGVGGEGVRSCLPFLESKKSALILEKMPRLCAPMVSFSLSEFSFKHLGDKTPNFFPFRSLFCVL